MCGGGRNVFDYVEESLKRLDPVAIQCGILVKAENTHEISDFWGEEGSQGIRAGSGPV